MLNEYMPYMFEDGTLISLPMPAFAVGFAIVDAGEKGLVCVVRKKTPKDESGYSAFLQATREYNTFKWQECEGSKLGRISTGAPDPYWVLVLKRSDPSSVSLHMERNDPMMETFKRTTNRGASGDKGVPSLDSILAALLPKTEVKSTDAAA